MKKFMTVLLVIAVMFTFSFSTAFAAPMTVEQSNLLAQAYTYAQGLVSANYDAAIKAVAKTDIGYPVTAAEWAAVATADDVNAFLYECYVAATQDNTAWGSESTAKAVASKVFASAQETKITGAAAAVVSEYAADGSTPQVVVDALTKVIINEFGVEAALYAYEADRLEAIGALDKVNYSVYSTDVNPDDAEGRTYLQIAQEAVADAKEYLADAAQYTTETWTWNVNVLPSLIDCVKTNATYTMGGVALKGVPYYVTAETYKGYATGMYLVNGVDTTTELAGQDALDAASKAVLKANVAQTYANYLTLTGADKTAADKALALVNFLIEEEVITSSNAALADITVWMVGPNFDENIAEIEELEVFAAKYKAEKDSEGNFVRDAKEVDKIVKAAKKAAYSDVYNAYDNSTAKADIMELSTDAAAAELAFQKESAKTLLNKALADKIGSYYPLEAAKVQKLYDEALAKVEAAKTVTSSMTTVTIPVTILNKTAVKNAVDFSTGAPATALDAVAKYVAYANTGKTAADDAYIPYATGSQAETIAKDAIANVYGEEGARKASEYKKVTVDTAAVVAQLPTAGAIKAAKKAAEDAIDDLPATITVANKDAVKAAWDLAKAYDKMVGGTAMVSSMASDVSALELAIKADLTKQYALADHDDEASLDAVKALLTEYKKLEGASNMYAKDTFTVVGLAGDYAAIQETERLAVVKAINAIPVNVTAEDKAVVEAARAAYDAYVAKYTDYTDFATGFAADDVATRELLLAEATLGLNDNSAEEAIAAIEGIKIKARSSAKKGSITVKWTVDEEVEGVKYQVYKSTKAQKGYKKAITTSKTSFKNTKNLKKGTRYFYKVRAIGEVDGVKYYSDWSNKANRIAK